MRLLYEPYVDSSGERMGICVRRKGLTAVEVLPPGFGDVRSMRVGAVGSAEALSLEPFGTGSGIGVFRIGPLGATVTDGGGGFDEDLLDAPALFGWYRVTVFEG
jgi:hypothetical protein